jgi:hypothetical protein
MVCGSFLEMRLSLDFPAIGMGLRRSETEAELKARGYFELMFCELASITVGFGCEFFLAGARFRT